MALIFPVMAWQGDPRISTRADWVAAVLMTAMFGLPTVVGAVFLWHHRIIADENGLTFRGFHHRRFVPWENVADFEFRAATQNEIRSTSASSGTAYLQIGEKWHRITCIYAPYDALLERIALEAKWSRARVWNHHDLRDDGEWPKVFQYHDKSGWRFAGIYFLCCFGLLGGHLLQAAAGGWKHFLDNITETWAFLPFWGRVGFVAMPLLGYSTLPLIQLTQFPAVVTRRRYLGQKIVASREGLSLFKNAREIFISWDEIESYHLETLPGSFQPDLCVVIAPEKRIEFVSGIQNTKALRALMQNRAKNASTTKWLHLHGADEDTLGGAISYYRSGTVGVGPKTYHYRTRTSRAMLGFGLILSVGCVAPLVTGHRNNNGIPTTKADVVMGLFFLCCVVVPTVSGVLGWLRSSLRCEDDGLHQNSIWGKRVAAWNEIERFTFDGYIFTVKSRARTIRYSATIADSMGLRAEIEARSGVKMKNNSQSALD